MEGLERDEDVSEWCILHVLARRFAIPALAEETLSRYQTCRSPFWQGNWLPRESEVDYLYRLPVLSIHMRNFIVNHFMAETFSSWSKGDIRELATLAASNVSFNCDILRAYKQHLIMEVHSSGFCGVQACLVHNQWTTSDVEMLERSPSATPELAESNGSIDGVSMEEKAATAATEVHKATAEYRSISADQLLGQETGLSASGA
ncbi:hypothetical protein ONS96_007357 [Cadophora gregata f. sp. sojae]|nr:hypothetical protein ONS96_007357 [Cadophora gregata f. sp. sojae]